MTITIKSRRVRARVPIRRKGAMASTSASASASPRLNTTTPTIVSANLTEAVDEEYEDLPPDSPSFTMIPDLFTSPPAIQDALSTLTSRAQDATMHECLPFLRGQVEHYEETDRHKHEGHLDASGRVNRHGVPRLDRERHVRFLHRTLGPLPSVFIGADASRPWMLYWALSALALLGEEVSPSSALGMGLVETARSMQNADTTGGFGGGHGQLSHLATSYAVVLALAVVGGPDAFEVVDRRAMWRWLCQLKMPNGGFRMSIGGEEGVRFVKPLPPSHLLRLSLYLV